MKKPELYLPWKSDQGNITCSARLDLLKTIGNLPAEIADEVVHRMNTYDELLEAGKAFLRYAKSNYSGDGMTALSMMESVIAKAGV